MQFNPKIQEALRHVQGVFPEVTQVFFGADGRWLFCDEVFDAPRFDDEIGKIDVDLLEEAADEAYADKGFPCAYRLLTLADYYEFWDKLGDIPVSPGDDEVEAETIEEAFLHFPVGTHREEIWRWFEAMHPDFVVGEVQQGVRRPVPEC